MATLLSPADRHQIEQADGEITSVANRIDDFARRSEEPDMALVRAWVKTARDWAERFNHSYAEALPVDARAEMRGVLIDALTLINSDSKPEDVHEDLDNFIIYLEQTRHILRDALDSDIGVDSVDARALINQLIEWLPGVPLKDLALLTGKTPRTLQRWRAEGGNATERLQLVARLVTLLRWAWTPPGVVAWFERPRDDLDGASPLDLLDDPKNADTLFEVVRHGRAGHGS